MKNNVDSIRQEYVDYINEHMEEAREGAENWKDNLEHSALFARGQITSRPLMIPRIYTKETIREFQKIADTAYCILTKVIREYLRCEDYRKLFPFSKELEELILIPTGYDSLLPLTRMDIFYHEDTGAFDFCEINADGSTGMDEDRIENDMMIHNVAHQEVLRHHTLRTFELLDSWVESFLSMYGNYQNRTEHPTVAIVDFLDKGIVREFEEFVRRFQRHGVHCEICDIRELTYQDGALYSRRGHRIDAIYRRAVTADIMEHFNEIGDFLSAIREQKVFMAGAFCTQIVHHKWIFHVLHLPRTKAFLTEEERDFTEKHIPQTVPLTPEWIAMEEVLKHKDRYIIKPDDAYGSKGVFAGVTMDQETWESRVREVYGTACICQKYCPQYLDQNMDVLYDFGTWRKFINSTGLYVYNGIFRGVLARAAASSGTIDFYANERRQVVYQWEP
mgnify:CR=1 FL=1